MMGSTGRRWIVGGSLVDRSSGGCRSSAAAAAAAWWFAFAQIQKFYCKVSEKRSDTDLNDEMAHSSSNDVGILLLLLFYTPSIATTFVSS